MWVYDRFRTLKSVTSFEESPAFKHRPRECVMLCPSLVSALV